MWLDGKKIIDVSQATVGIIPPGAAYVWCDQADVDNIFVAGAGQLTGVSFAGPQTTSTGPWTLDIDDFIWWQ
jgi:hypothetical protein